MILARMSPFLIWQKVPDKKSAFPKINTQRRAKRADRAQQTKQNVKTIGHVYRFDDARNPGNQTPDDRANHHCSFTVAALGKFRRQGEGDHIIRGIRSIRTANRTGYGRKHSTANGLDVEGITLAATALDFYRNHDNYGLRVRCDFCNRIPRAKRYSLVNPMNLADCQELSACVSRQTRELHAEVERNAPTAESIRFYHLEFSFDLFVALLRLHHGFGCDRCG
jgi:hypothetical protein